LSHVAFEAAYRDGREWVRELREHLWHNYEMLKELCDNYSDKIKIIPIEATYLAWLDCRGMGISNRALRNFFVQEAKLGLNAGISFGREGDGFMRLNFALSSAKMTQLIQRLQKALDALR
jgi:cystathionine beta-lyase